MKYYVGLDISNKETSICIVDQDNNIVKEAKVLTDPQSIHTFLCSTKLKFEQTGLETGSLSHWLVTSLRAKKWNVVCICSRVMSAVLSTGINKTDKRDARAIANAIRCKNYKEIFIKSTEAIKLNCLLTVRKALVKQHTQLRNVVRGILKTFGIKLVKGASKPLQQIIRETLAFDEFSPEDERLSSKVDWDVIQTLVESSEKVEEQLKIIEDRIKVLANEDKVTKRFMTMPGIGPVTALTYKVVIDDPKRFKRSRSIGAYLGMTPRQFSSGESIKMGRISKMGATDLRVLLAGAGKSMLTKCKKQSKLKSWGLGKKRKKSSRQVYMAMGRKMGVILHRMWLEEKDFDHKMEEGEFCREEALIEAEKQKRKEERQLRAIKNKEFGKSEKARRELISHSLSTQPVTFRTRRNHKKKATGPRSSKAKGGM
jgi:transposase